MTESEPVTAGKAATATTPTSADTSTAAPRPTNRLRGMLLPGSRASWARLASVSRPVYASIATGSAKASECQVGATPGWAPCPRSDGENRKAKPSTIRITSVTNATTATTIAIR